MGLMGQFGAHGHRPVWAHLRNGFNTEESYHQKGEEPDSLCLKDSAKFKKQQPNVSNKFPIYR